MEDIIKFFNSQKSGVFLFTHLKDAINKRSYLFQDPIDEIICHEPQKIWGCFEKIEEALDSNYFLAGFFSYELGYFLDDVCPVSKKAPSEDWKCRKTHEMGCPPETDSQLSNGVCMLQYGKITPLIWLGVFEKCKVYRNLSLQDLKIALGKKETPSRDYWIKDIRVTIDKEEYLKNIDKAKEYITCGDIYQINYTFQLEYDVFGNIPDLFLDLNNKQKVSYSAYIKQGSSHVLSLSPELFFKREGKEMLNKPMKGTIHRSSDIVQDTYNKEYLENSDKNKAENLMIVDLVRNDLGRICEIGSIEVPKLFEIEGYETLYQMTSTICGRLKDDVKWVDIFKSLFPCGSVTGAPKIRSMQIIHELEKKERGVYTGAIGFISPKDEAVFNIPIRTVAIDEDKSRGKLGVGSGIVVDSSGSSEYEECLLKAKYFTDLGEDYKLIETMLWEKEKGFFLLGLHLERLENSARYFKIPFDSKMILQTLEEVESNFCEDRSYKVRLLFDKNGKISISFSEFFKSTNDEILRITFSDIRTDSGNVFLYHKTTNRFLYDHEYQRYEKCGFVDVIFENEKGEITEGSISNVFVQKNGIFMTPPVSSGLLDGTYRRHLLRNGGGQYIEKVLYRSDLAQADAIYLSNSVRGLFKVQLCEEADIKKQTSVSFYEISGLGKRR